MSNETQNINKTELPAETLAILNAADGVPTPPAPAEPIPAKTDQEENPDAPEIIEDKDKNLDENEKPKGEENPEGEKPAETELSDEKVVAYLKSKNIEVSNIDELATQFAPKPVEETEEQIALRKLELDKWAITNKKVDPKKLEAFKEDSQLSKIELAFKVYANDRNGEINDETGEPYTEEELRSEFEDDYKLYADDLDPKKKRALKDIALIADTYLHTNYKELNSLESDFENEVEQTQKIQTLNNTVQSAKSELIKNGLSWDLKDELGAEISVKYPLTKKQIEEISVGVSDVSDPSNMTEVQSAIIGKYIKGNLPKILHEVATTYHSQKILDKTAQNNGIQIRVSEHAKRASALPKEALAILDAADQIK